MFGPLILGIVFASIFVIAIILGVVSQVVKSSIGTTWRAVATGVVAVVMIIPTLVCFGCGIINPINAEKEYYEFIETKYMIEYAIDPNQSLANVDLTQKVTRENEWLVNAKRLKTRWGNWSRYYKLDLDSLTYITMKVDTSTLDLGE